MPQPLRQIKNRIRSIENTKKVTSVMELVSVSKLNRIEKIRDALRPYQAGLRLLIDSLISSKPEEIDNLFFKNREKKKLVLCVITSDNGLCGLYNVNIIRAADEFINKNGSDKVKLIVVGKKGLNYFNSKKFKILRAYVGLNGRYDDIISDQICSILKNLFLTGEADEVYVAYSRFEVGAFNKVMVEKFVNIEKPAQGKEIKYIFEPDFESILKEALTKYIIIKMRLIFLEAFSSEHTARSISMHAATDNAKELLEGLILLKNKVRQANITQEIMEIISSVEALKG